MDKKIVAEQRIEAKADKAESSETTTGHIFYAVEARSSVKDPVEYNGNLYGNQWKRISFVRGFHGVAELPFYSWATERGYYSYLTAMALACVVRAHAAVEINVGLKVRIVEFVGEWSCSFTKVAEFEPLYWRGRPRYEDDVEPDAEAGRR